MKGNKIYPFAFTKRNESVIWMRPINRIVYTDGIVHLKSTNAILFIPGRLDLQSSFIAHLS